MSKKTHHARGKNGRSQQYGRGPRPVDSHQHATGNFINPYNFVSFEALAPPPKGKPPSHEKFTGLSGKITCGIEVITPLAIPDSENTHGLSECLEHKVKPFLTVDSKPYIPGASIKGAIRSVMETVTNSCMSVLTEQLAVFRDNRDFAVYNRRLGQLSQMSDGNLRIIDINPDSSNKNSIMDYERKGNPERDIWRERLQLVRNERSNLFPEPNIKKPAPTNTKKKFGIYKWFDLLRGLFGDSERRDHNKTGEPIPIHEKKNIERRRKGKPVVIRWPVAETQNRPQFELDQEVKKSYDAMIQSDEFRQFDDEKIILEPWQKEYLKTKPNEIFWYRVQEKTNHVIQFGRNYRFKWAYDPRQAIPEAFYPCTKPDQLCPVCALLGMASEQRRMDRESGKQYVEVNARAGRVAFGPAKWLSGGPLEKIDNLKILNTPKPSCRSFYLHPHQRDASNVENEEYVELKNDKIHTTLARGRKFYWHHSNHWFRNPSGWKDYFQKKKVNGERKPTKLNSSIEAVPVGTTFEFDVEFENLSEWELGMLLWTLSLPEDGNLAHHLGGGKPLGLGSVKIAVKKLNLINRFARYEKPFVLGADKIIGDGATAIDLRAPENEELANYVESFRGQIKEWNKDTDFSAIPHVKDLLTMLRLDQPAIDETAEVKISYPPGIPGKPKEDTDAEELHYTWFSKYKWGQRLYRVDEIRDKKYQEK